MKIISENASTFYITCEEMVNHLVEDHGWPRWSVSNKFQVELENFHNRYHKRNGWPKEFKDGEFVPMGKPHSHAKKVEICGYDVTSRQDEIIKYRKQKARK